MRQALFTLCALSLAACTDVRGYQGSWNGAMVESPTAAVSDGFPPGTAATLTLDKIDRVAIAGTLTTNDGLYSAAPLTPVRAAANDALANLSFDGDPLRTYFTTAKPADGSAAALVLVTLLPSDRAEVRIIRAEPLLYGVFKLSRQ